MAKKTSTKVQRTPHHKVNRTAHRPPQSPTLVEYNELEHAFDWFNAELFESSLPKCFLTLECRANSLGHFAYNFFVDRVGGDGRLHKLSLNPDGFTGKPDEEILSTLCHEMTHCWQFCHGQQKPKRAYHNQEWADGMKAIGLHPSSTGMPGGNETGQRMDHFIVDGGPFQVAYEKLTKTGFKLNWQSAVRSNRQKKGSGGKEKFTCGCRNMWGADLGGYVCDRCGGVTAQVAA